MSTVEKDFYEQAADGINAIAKRTGISPHAITNLVLDIFNALTIKTKDGEAA